MSAVIPEENQSVTDWLAELPMVVDRTDLIVDFPANDEKGRNVVVNTRIPPQWLEAIIEIREKVNTRFPNIWKTNGACFRWLYYMGLRELQRIQQEVEEGTTHDDPMLQARFFLEREVNKVSARAEIISDTLKRVEEIAKALELTMILGETYEASKIINTWVENALNQDEEFWRPFFIRVILLNPELRVVVQTLRDNGAEIHEVLVNELDNNPPSEKEWKALKAKLSASHSTSESLSSSPEDGIGEQDSVS